MLSGLGKRSPLLVRNSDTLNREYKDSANPSSGSAEVDRSLTPHITFGMVRDVIAKWSPWTSAVSDNRFPTVCDCNNRFPSRNALHLWQWRAAQWTGISDTRCRCFSSAPESSVFCTLCTWWRRSESRKCCSKRRREEPMGRRRKTSSQSQTESPTRCSLNGDMFTNDKLTGATHRAMTPGRVYSLDSTLIN